MIKLNTLDFMVGRGWGLGEEVRIKVMRIWVYQKLAAEDKLN